MADVSLKSSLELLPTLQPNLMVSYCQIKARKPRCMCEFIEKLFNDWYWVFKL